MGAQNLTRQAAACPDVATNQPLCQPPFSARLPDCSCQLNMLHCSLPPQPPRSTSSSMTSTTATSAPVSGGEGRERRPAGGLMHAGAAGQTGGHVWPAANHPTSTAAGYFGTSPLQPLDSAPPGQVAEALLLRRTLIHAGCTAACAQACMHATAAPRGLPPGRAGRRPPQSSNPATTCCTSSRKPSVPRPCSPFQ